MFATAYRSTGNAGDAEDVLQTVFLRLLRRGGSAGPLADLGLDVLRLALGAFELLAREALRGARADVPKQPVPNTTLTSVVAIRMLFAFTFFPPCGRHCRVLGYGEASSTDKRGRDLLGGRRLRQLQKR